MPGRDLLERFRPSGAPGAAGRVGVPAEESRDVEALAVIAALEPVLAQARAMREEAERAVHALGAQTDRSVQEIEDDARLRAAQAHAEAAAGVRESGRQESRRLVEAASAEAAGLLARADRELVDVVDHVVASVRRTLHLGERDGAGAGERS